MTRFRDGRWSCPFTGMATGIVLACALFSANAAAANGGGAHNEATAALNDLQAAIGELDRASNLTVSDPQPYKTAAQRALNAVVGSSDSEFNAHVGNPGDSQGALGHLEQLTGWAHGEPWAKVVRGSWVNTRVAESHLLDAVDSKELDDFQLAMSVAIEALEVAVGSDSTLGTLGGLQGALATTTLGVPAGARIVPGCSAPTKAPAYGVTGGYLLYIALPGRGRKTQLPAAIGISGVSFHGGIVVLHTAAAGLAEKLCRHHAAISSSVVEANAAVSTELSAARHAGDKGASGGVSALYTGVQAQAGRQVFMHICATCHGKDLQGRSGPQIAGTAFLKKAKLLGWSVGDLRALVLTTMPRSNPGSLKPQQYAQVLAYLLAVNCYPPGHSNFPTKKNAALNKTPLEPLSNVGPDNGALGTCQVPRRQLQHG